MYGGLRLGLYEPLKGVVGLHGDGLSDSHRTARRVVAGSLSGGFAAAVANPLDLVKVPQPPVTVLLTMRDPLPLFAAAGRVMAGARWAEYMRRLGHCAAGEITGRPRRRSDCCHAAAAQRAGGAPYHHSQRRILRPLAWHRAIRCAQRDAHCCAVRHL